MGERIRSPVFVVLALIAGCASVDPVPQDNYMRQSPPGGGAAVPVVPPGAEIAIGVAGLDASRLDVQVTNARVSEYARTGAKGGAVGGAAGGLGICLNPLLIAGCPVIVAVTALVGTAYGGGVGAAVGAIRDVPEETREALRSSISSAAASYPPHEHVVGAIREKAKSGWKVVDSPARNSLAVHAHRVVLHVRGEDNVALSVGLRISLTTHDDRGAQNTEERWVQSATEPSAAAAWQDAEFARKSLAELYQRVSQEVIDYLARRER